jgi:hypothetical protein
LHFRLGAGDDVKFHAKLCSNLLTEKKFIKRLLWYSPEITVAATFAHPLILKFSDHNQVLLATPMWEGIPHLPDSCIFFLPFRPSYQRMFLDKMRINNLPGLLMRGKEN